jgi:quercetin dioxygenase-like cupin family protein
MKSTVLAIAIVACALAQPSFANAQPVGPKVELLQSHALSGVPGKDMTSVLVTFPPGFHDHAHHHAGSVFVYILSGTMRTAFAMAPVATLHAGQSFFEAAGVHHRVAENASSTQPLRLLVTTVAAPGTPPAIYDAMH